MSAVYSPLDSFQVGAYTEVETSQNKNNITQHSKLIATYVTPLKDSSVRNSKMFETARYLKKFDDVQFPNFSGKKVSTY